MWTAVLMGAPPGGIILVRVFDGHNDALLSLHRPERGHGRSFLERSEFGHVDLPRAIEGGYAGGFFAVFVPPEKPLSLEDVIATRDGYEVPPLEPVTRESARRQTLAMIGFFEQFIAASAGQVRHCRTRAELAGSWPLPGISAILHLEGAEAIEPDLSDLDEFTSRGVRSIGPVWSRPNEFGHGVPFRFPSSPDTGPGLTDAGRALVRACNDLGILLD
ncbi:membrane dipeptidase, partial [Candidatus Poribacteria bacterium]|nr:membrane dipeptidase [Candidatus Poribacteria bacterium]